MSISECPYETLAARISACPECTKPFTAFDLKSMHVTPEEAAAWLDGNPRQIQLQGLTYYCSACISKIEKANDAERAQSRIRQMIHNTYRLGYMPKCARDETFENASEAIMRRNENAWIVAMKYPLEKNLWEKGNPGTGKTFMAHCIANNYLVHGKATHSVTGIEINGSGDFYEERKAHFVKGLKTCALLVIDDLDKPTWTPRGLDVLFQIMHARAADKSLRLIVTANGDGKWLLSKWQQVRTDNPSIARSILERMMPIQSMELTGASLRIEQLPGTTE